MTELPELRRIWTTGSRLEHGGLHSGLHSGLPHTRVGSLLDAQNDMGPLLDFLSDDDRPTLIIEDYTRTPRIVFSNPAFRRFLDKIKHHEDFEGWIESLPDSTVNKERLRDFGGKSWFSKSLKHAWRIVQCRQPQETVQSLASRGRRVSASGSPSQSTWGDIIDGGRKLIDWTRDQYTSPNPWIQAIKDFNFDDTPIGAMKNWPPELCRLAVVIMACPDPRMIYWGNNQEILYNEAAATILSHGNRSILGMRFVDVYGVDIYNRHIQFLRNAIFDGKSDQETDFCAMVMRDGRMEETYWNIHLLPVPGLNGHTIAAINEYTESTSDYYNEQRRKLVAKISEHTSLAESLPLLWKTFLTDLEDHMGDFLYVSVYTAEEGSEEVYHLQGSGGVDANNFPQVVEIGEGNSKTPDLSKAFRSARKSQHVLRLYNEDLPQHLMLEVPERGTVESACILPISSMSGHQLAFVVLGLNPRRRYTEVTGLFITHVRDLLLRFAAVISLPEEQYKDQLRFEELNLALTQQLRITALKSEKNEETFTRMARNAPFGMYLYSPSGEPKFVNDSYLELLSMSRAELVEKSQSGLAWRDTVFEEDIECG